ncbi:MAG: hypothetical protein ABSE99_03735 [Terracidiphilus sp.]|jgi:enoyl-CoA hydratase/carnithine racemase
MTEAYEKILRKSLDSVDRRQKWMKIIAVAMIVLACVNAGLGMANLHDMRLLYIVTYVGLVFWTGGLAVAILGVSGRNAQLILRAIALISEQNGDASAPPVRGTLDQREG